MIEQKLIYDIGLHNGDDTAFYLKEDYKVIAVDANPMFIENAKKKFTTALNNNQLVLVNQAISKLDNEKLTFYISHNSEWSSLNENIANREANLKEKILVSTIKLSTLMETYGTPHYCKIDIEGHDPIALESMKDLKNKPTYISVESECMGDTGEASDEDALATLIQLHQLGYRKFKLVDQITFCVLPQKELFYSKTNLIQANLWEKIVYKIKLGVPPTRHRLYLQDKFKFTFNFGSSGIFGEHLQGEWLTFEEAKKCLLMHRKDFFSQRLKKNYEFWCDWHATK